MTDWRYKTFAVDWAALVDLTVRLVELRQNKCEHLAVENIGPEIFGKLLRECARMDAADDD